MGKICELCGKIATIHCGADDAELCWTCDAEVHGANYLVARHLRSVLCSCCSAETECQTSGTCPCPLSRRCAACDPAHVNGEQQGNLTGSVLSECNDDSEDMPPPSVPWLGMVSAATQECLSDALSSVEDEKIGRKSLGDSSKGRPKRMRGGGSGGSGSPTKRGSISPSQSKRHGLGRKSRRRRSGSPVSVIRVDYVFSNES
ncbi:unnamed protein product [Calypogeia fissa]